LEPHSQTNITTDERRVLEDQVRECYGRVIYTHKTHEKCADILLARLAKIKLALIILSAVTTGGFIGVIFGEAYLGSLFGGIASLFLLILNTYMKDYDLGELAQKHKRTANDLWLIREKYLSLLVDIHIKKLPLESLLEARDILLQELHAIYIGAPSTTYSGYLQAQNALKVKEDMTFSEEEIDNFLPHNLKRVK
jgi:hypothetical protein